MKKVRAVQIFFIIFDIFIIFILGVLFALKFPVTSGGVIYIPKGGVSTIISNLSDKKINVNPMDRYFLYIIGRPQHGWISIKEGNLTKADFLYRLTVAKAAMEPVTLIPGETTEVFLDDVAKKLGLNSFKLREIYLDKAPLKEGFLIAETYMVPKGIDEKTLIELLIKLSDTKQKQLYKELIGGEFDTQKFSTYVTIASIIQKEAANLDEMSTVSSVIYNRLKIDMPLQMDGTLNYGKFSHEKITSERIKTDTSAYNTYLNKGLPPSAVCCVGEAALRAAIKPLDTNFLYFVKDKTTGVHIFSRSYKEHTQNINNQKMLK